MDVFFTSNYTLSTFCELNTHNSKFMVNGRLQWRNSSMTDFFIVLGDDMNPGIPEHNAINIAANFSHQFSMR